MNVNRDFCWVSSIFIAFDIMSKFKKKQLKNPKGILPSNIQYIYADDESDTNNHDRIVVHLWYLWVTAYILVLKYLKIFLPKRTTTPIKSGMKNCLLTILSLSPNQPNI